MRVFRFALIVFFIAGISCAHAEIEDLEVTLVSVDDSRVSGSSSFFSSLEIELDVASSLIKDTKSYRFNVRKAEDNLGVNLLEEGESQERFTELEGWMTGDDGKIKIRPRLKNPARSATHVKELSCELEFYVPGKDPLAEVVIDDFSQYIGTPLSPPKLKKADIELKVLSIKGTKISMEIKDPRSNILLIEFIDSNGKKITWNGRASFGNPEQYKQEWELNEALPEGSKLRIFVMTDKSIIKESFSFKDIALP